MLVRAETYEDVCQAFRWTVPERFNIAEAACDRHVGARREALVYEDADGRIERFSFEALKDLSSRLANALAANGAERGDRAEPPGLDVLERTVETCRHDMRFAFQQRPHRRRVQRVILARDVELLAACPLVVRLRQREHRLRHDEVARAGRPGQQPVACVELDVAVERAIADRTPMVVEGVHLLPDIPSAHLCERATTVRVMIALRDEDEHREHFHTRGMQTLRAPERYLEALDRETKLAQVLGLERRQKRVPTVAEVLA